MMKLDFETAKLWIEMRADGVLDKEKTAVLEAYLETCPECRAYADALRQFEHELSDSLQTRWPRPAQMDVAPVLKRLEQQQRVRWVVGGVKTAVLFAAFLALFGVWLVTLREPANVVSVVQPAETATGFPTIAPTATRPPATATPMLLPLAEPAGLPVFVNGEAAMVLAEPFEMLEAIGYGNVTMVQGETAVLHVTIDEEYLDLLIVEVVDGTLRLGNEYSESNRWSIINFELTVPTVSGIRVGGSGNVESDVLVTERLTLDLSGSGNLTLTSVVVTQMDVQINGSGNITIHKAGIVGQLAAQVNGSGNLTAWDTLVREAEVTTGGSATVRLRVTQTLKATAGGSSAIIYRGSPEVEEVGAGNGSVRQESP